MRPSRIGSAPLAAYREIYLIRHGATALNSESGGVDRIRGWKNVQLSEKGREEIKALAQKLKDSGIKTLVSSDLDRAAETAHAIAATTGARVTLTKQFRPWDLGEFTGQESSSIHPVIADFATRKPDTKIPGGEAFNEFRYRVFNGLREYLWQNPDDLLGIVTHHRDERLLKAWIEKGQPRNLGLDLNVMFRHGEKTAHAEVVKIDLGTLYGSVDAR